MPITHFISSFRRPVTMHPTALGVSRILNHQTRCKSSGSIQISQSLQSIHGPARRAFSPVLVRKIVQARGVTTIPIQQGNTKVQHVKLVAPSSRWFVTGVIPKLLFVYILLEVLGLGFLNKKPEDIADVTDATHINSVSIQENKAGADGEPVSQDENEDETIEIDEENAIFLPFTWPRRKPPVPYKAADEEWQEFCSFAKDGEKQRAVQGQVVEYALFVANHHPQLKRVLGKISPQSRYWLDIDYPLRYDEGYEMTGIVVTDDFIAVASRDYDESTVEHFQRIISTLPMISALWNVTKALFMGEETLTTATKKNDHFPVALPGVPDLDSSPEFVKVLRSSIKQLRSRPPALKSVPRGCVKVSGRVDIHGSKAWAEFAIMGYYSPKHNAWNALPAIGLGPVRPVSIRPAG